MFDANTIMTVLIPALIQVESGGDARKVGDNGKAVGVLQIHNCVVDDVNKSFTDIPNVRLFGYSDRRDSEASKMMCRAYLGRWGIYYMVKTGEKPTFEVLARIWNGGPNGYRKKATLKYWEKVKKELAKRPHKTYETRILITKRG